MKKTIIIMAALLTSVAASAQHADRATLEQISSSNPIGLRPGSSLYSLFDFSKIRWSHSYSVSYLSGGNYNGSMGMLHTSMLYPISSSLNLTMDLGLAHGISGNLTTPGKNVSVLPSFWLDFKPGKNVSMSLSFQTINGLTWPYAYRGARYPSNLIGPE